MKTENNIEKKPINFHASKIYHILKCRVGF